MKDLIFRVRKAMEEGEIKPYYQPQYDSVTRKLISAEALARWVKTDGTVIPPAEFVPELEKDTSITELDWHILKCVCSLIKKQLDTGITAVPIAVNFSRRHINSSLDFADKLCDVVDGFGIPHKYIKAEITESALVENPELIEDFVSCIRTAGFSVAIDDFGSGVSSLSFVKDVDVDILKIDKSLLSRNCEDEKERIVLESIFNFAHRLNLMTIAEGVETREQLGFLRTCDCRAIQGFIFAKPMPEEEFLEACRLQTNTDNSEDILKVQAASGAMQMLLEIIFKKYPLVIFSNLTRNSYYMMAYENFTSTGCPSTGAFDELIYHGANSMHPDDREIFASTFSAENLINQYNSGKESVRLVTRQMGNDGIYRKVETTDYFVKSPSVDDVLVITLCDNLE